MTTGVRVRGRRLPAPTSRSLDTERAWRCLAAPTSGREAEFASGSAHGCRDREDRQRPRCTPSPTISRAAARYTLSLSGYDCMERPAGEQGSGDFSSQQPLSSGARDRPPFAGGRVVRGSGLDTLDSAHSGRPRRPGRSARPARLARRPDGELAGGECPSARTKSSGSCTFAEVHRRVLELGRAHTVFRHLQDCGVARTAERDAERDARDRRAPATDAGARSFIVTSRR